MSYVSGDDEFLQLQRIMELAGRRHQTPTHISSVSPTMLQPTQSLRADTLRLREHAVSPSLSALASPVSAVQGDGQAKRRDSALSPSTGLSEPVVEAPSMLPSTRPPSPLKRKRRPEDTAASTGRRIHDNETSSRLSFSSRNKQIATDRSFSQPDSSIRRQSLPKRQPKSYNRQPSSSDASEIPTCGQVIQWNSTSPPSIPWYDRLTKSNSRTKSHSEEDTKLGLLKSTIESSLEKEGSTKEAYVNRLVEIIHDAQFLTVTKQLLRDNRLLHSPILPAVIQHRDFPSFLRSDAEELWFRWANENFDVDLMHGISFSAKSPAAIKAGYKYKRSADVTGHNNLVNGQWWPQQICLVRDGAHGSSQGGIYGRKGDGAWSVVISGSSYPDRDDGYKVEYCGTDSEDGLVTENTRRLIETYELDRPLRLIRSSKSSHKTYRPEEGFRYDGLYKITSYEVLDLNIQRHRFTLIREPDQDPIRHAGLARRPTPQEIKAWKELHSSKKWIVSES